MFYKTAKLRNMLNRLEKQSSAAKAGVNLVKALLGSGAQTGIKAIPKTLGAVAPKIEGALGGAAAKAERAFFPSPGGGMSLGVNPKGALHLPSAEELKRSGQDAWHALDSTASPRTPFSFSRSANSPLTPPPIKSPPSTMAASDSVRNPEYYGTGSKAMPMKRPVPSMAELEAQTAALNAQFAEMEAQTAAHELQRQAIINKPQNPYEFISPFKRSWEQFDKFSHDQRFREKRAIAALLSPLFKAVSRAPLTTAAAGLGGMAGYEFARQPKKLANPALLPSASTPPPQNTEVGLGKTSLDKQILSALLRR